MSIVRPPPPTIPYHTHRNASLCVCRPMSNTPMTRRSAADAKSFSSNLLATASTTKPARCKQACRIVSAADRFAWKIRVLRVLTATKPAPFREAQLERTSPAGHSENRPWKGYNRTVNSRLPKTSQPGVVALRCTRGSLRRQNRRDCAKDGSQRVLRFRNLDHNMYTTTHPQTRGVFSFFLYFLYFSHPFLIVETVVYEPNGDKTGVRKATKPARKATKPARKATKPARKATKPAHTATCRRRPHVAARGRIP